MLTDDQIDRVFRLTLGVHARWADIQVARLLGGTPGQLGTYIWDHWMSEPQQPSEEQVQTVVQFIVAHPEMDDDAAIAGAVSAIGV